ncbi:flocculation protein FLO11-like, partial [Selaginella moellendorffii]|uniref:flocculation protein FLO11-like n=1 Tax=Selaginella moellendorffii TaxID=88036 RepID=UPI000D1CB7B6
LSLVFSLPDPGTSRKLLLRDREEQPERLIPSGPSDPKQYQNSISQAACRKEFGVGIPAPPSGNHHLEREVPTGPEDPFQRLKDFVACWNSAVGKPHHDVLTHRSQSIPVTSSSSKDSIPFPPAASSSKNSIPVPGAASFSKDPIPVPAAAFSSKDSIPVPSSSSKDSISVPAATSSKDSSQSGPATSSINAIPAARSIPPRTFKDDPSSKQLNAIQPERQVPSGADPIHHKSLEP